MLGGIPGGGRAPGNELLGGGGPGGGGPGGDALMLQAEGEGTDRKAQAEVMAKLIEATRKSEIGTFQPFFLWDF